MSGSKFPFFGIQSSVSGVAVNIAKVQKALGNEVTVLSFLGVDMEERENEL